ncbi:MAG: hypothetical protein C7B43_09775 [Sulfobacillus benefaciens]|jgi:hypothetical protein|uniref:TadE-like domain-containing protein n=1 Tax=Sulfobacillus benefaciens TaxID=453960 RepID=A0A2T2X2I9_9FIRM|nr:MAG: hypothetical protein C7B43_09775 [Sulfobacillus benefaciens]
MRNNTCTKRLKFRGIGGQALVETALVLPLVLLLLFAIVSYGLYINAVDTIQQAVRVGARTAAIGDTLGCPGDSAATQLSQGHHPTVYGAVDDQLNHDKPWLSTGSGSTAIPVISYAAIIGNDANPQQNNVIVTVAYSYHPVIPIPGLLPNPVEVAQTYQMMVETPQPSNGTTPTMPTGSPYEETAQWTQPPPPTAGVTYLIQPGGC